MLTQRRIGRSEASKLGVSIFDCRGLSIEDMRELIRAESLARSPQRTLESAKAPTQPDPTISVDADQIVEVKDASRDNRTMELSADEVEVVSAPRPARADESYGSVTALLADIDRRSGIPPAQPRQKMIGERSEDSVLFQMDGDAGGSADSSVLTSLEEIRGLGSEAPKPEPRRIGQRSEDSVLFQVGEPASSSGDSSVQISLEEVQRLGLAMAAERAANPPREAAAKIARAPESSVEMSLHDLDDLERERVAREEAQRKEAEAAAAEERRKTEAARREREDAAEKARIRQAEEQLGRAVDELLESSAPEEGGERSLVYKMGEVEMLLYSDMLRQGRSAWLLPVGLSGRPGEDAATMAGIGDAPTITIADKTYFICAQRHGVEKAVEAVRKGTTLTLSKKPLEIPVEVEIEADEPAAQEGGLPWKQEYITHMLEGDDLVAARIVLPERAVRWLMPAPDETTKEAAARAILKRFGDEPRLTINGKSYFVFQGAEGFAGAKWCARTGNMLQAWSASATDYELDSSMGGSEPAVRALEPTDSEGPGLKWDGGHVRHILQGDELVSAFGALPERAVRWLIPAPEAGASDKTSQSIRKKFGSEPRLTVKGKEYYVYEGEDGFANAHWCARIGNILNVWPQAMTEYDYMGSVGGSVAAGALRTVRESGWPERFFYHDMDAAERQAWTSLFKERTPILLHPVPDADTGISHERTMLEEMPKVWGCHTVSLGGKSYYAVRIDGVNGWKAMVAQYPQTRIASADGDQLSIWEEAGRSLFVSTTFRIFETSEVGPPLPAGEGRVVPYDEEILDVELLHQSGKKSRYIYPLPENVGDMGIETFNNLLAIATGEARRTGQSPLITIQGRWYFALEYSYAGTRVTSFQEGALTIHPEGYIASSQGEEEFVRLPSDPRMRHALRTSFPPGEVRYLYEVDSNDPNYEPRGDDMIVKDGAVTRVWRMADHPIPGVTRAVIRKGERIIPLREEPGSAELERPAPSPVRSGARDPTVELDVGDLMVEPPQPSAPSPPRRMTSRGPPPAPSRRPAEKKAEAPKEPSGAIEIHTGEYELADDEPES